MSAIKTILIAGATLAMMAAIATPIVAQDVIYVYVWPSQAPNPYISNYYHWTPNTPNGGFVGAAVPGHGTAPCYIRGPNLGGVQIQTANYNYPPPPAADITWPTQFVSR
jgi:hypothetical protein